MTTIAPKVWTEAALLALPHDGYKYELMDGELHTMPPAMPDHGVISVNIIGLLREFCRPRKLGVILDGQTGFYMKNGDLFSPDISFVSANRWKKVSKEKRKKFFRGSPDLAVEVISATRRRKHLEGKIAAYLENDTLLSWLVDSVAATVTVFAAHGEPQVLGTRNTLSGGPVLPGLAISVADIFENANGG